MKLMQWSGLFLLTLFSSFLYAQSDSDALTDLLLSTKTMQANFSQSVKDKSARSLQTATGKMALERPGKFRWEITQPNNQVTIVNGVRIWVYDVDLEQVTINQFNHAAQQTPALLLSDKNLTLSRDYQVRKVPNPSQIAGTQTFQLTPKDKENMFAAISLSFLNKQIREMRLEDHLGHITKITFQNVKTGIPLSNALFVFKPKAGVDVIDETKDKH